MTTGVSVQSRDALHTAVGRDGGAALCTSLVVGQGDGHSGDDRARRDGGSQEGNEDGTDRLHLEVRRECLIEGGIR